MNEAKHTPGPWEVKGYNIIWSSAAKTSVAIFLDADWPRGNRPSSPEANARLIAAAPELLEALKAMIDAERAYESGVRSSEELDALEKAHAAITKATWRADSAKAAKGAE